MIEQICFSLQGTTQDLKYGSDYCFLVNQKLFCIKTLEAPHQISFKAPTGEIGNLTSRGGIVKGKNYNWVKVNDINALSKREWEYYIRQSYLMVSSN